MDDVVIEQLTVDLLCPLCPLRILVVEGLRIVGFKDLVRMAVEFWSVDEGRIGAGSLTHVKVLKFLVEGSRSRWLIIRCLSQER